MSWHTVSNVLNLCEQATLGREADDGSCEEASHRDLASQLRYLSAQAGAAWSPEFEALLSGSHSMRVVVLDSMEKELHRDKTGTCMACGREEKNCAFAIDLAGNFDASEWLRSASNVPAEFEAFQDEYVTSIESIAKSEKSCRKDACVHQLDKGRFVLGQTCLRKASLKFMLNTILLEWAYSYAASGGESLGETHEKRVDAAYGLLCQIRLAVADDKRPVPDVAIDDEFWKLIDSCRQAAAAGAGVSETTVVCQQAKQALTNECHEQKEWKAAHKQSRFREANRNRDREPAHEDKHGRGRAQKRRCVVVQSDSESDGEEAGPASRGASSGKQPQAASEGVVTRGRARSKSPIQCCGDPGPSTSSAPQTLAGCSIGSSGQGSASDSAARPSTGEPASVEPAALEPAAVEPASASEPAALEPAAVEPASASEPAALEPAAVESASSSEPAAPEQPACFASKRVPTPITSMVAMQRAAGVLPSRRGVIMDSMELQIKLQREGRFRDAAVITNAIMTLHELLERVDQLRHTV